MSADEPTSLSPIGDPIPLQGIFKGFNIYVTFAGAIVARATEIEVNANNNLEEIYEAGNRHPLIVPGNFSCGGTLTGYAFDTAKFSMAVGLARESVNPQVDILLEEDTFADSLSSPEFGNQPYNTPPRFTVTCELHIPSEGKWIEYIIEGAVIDNWRLSGSQPGEARETTTFMGKSIGKKIRATAIPSN